MYSWIGLICICCAFFFLSPSFVEDDPVEKTAAPEDQGKVRYKGSWAISDSVAGGEPWRNQDHGIGEFFAVVIACKTKKNREIFKL